MDKQGIGEYTADEINVKEVFFALWSSKILIILMVATFAVGSVIYSLSIPNKFTSSSLLKISNSGSSQSSSNSNLDMIGSIAGINFSGGGTSKSSLVTATIESRDFLKIPRGGPCREEICPGQLVQRLRYCTSERTSKE